MISLHKLISISEAWVVVETDFLSPLDPRRARGYGPLRPTYRMERATVTAGLPTLERLQRLSVAPTVTFLRKRWRVMEVEIGFQKLTIGLVRDVV